LSAIIRTIERGHPTVPTPTRATGFSKPVVPKHAKLDSWKTFEKNASFWTFSEKDDIYRIEKWKKRSEGGWLPDPERIMVLPAGTFRELAIKQLIELGPNRRGGLE
jgi:hypothetical protein